MESQGAQLAEVLVRGEVLVGSVSGVWESLGVIRGMDETRGDGILDEIHEEDETHGDETRDGIRNVGRVSEDGAQD